MPFSCAVLFWCWSVMSTKPRFNNLLKLINFMTVLWAENSCIIKNKEFCTTLLLCCAKTYSFWSRSNVFLFICLIISDSNECGGSCSVNAECLTCLTSATLASSPLRVGCVGILTWKPVVFLVDVCANVYLHQ